MSQLVWLPYRLSAIIELGNDNTMSYQGTNSLYLRLQWQTFIPIVSPVQMFFFALSLLIIVFPLLWLLKSWTRRSGSLPPGPSQIKLPRLLLSISHRPHLLLKKWVEFYGPIFTLPGPLFVLSPEEASSSSSIPLQYLALEPGPPLESDFQKISTSFLREETLELISRLKYLMGDGNSAVVHSSVIFGPHLLSLFISEVDEKSQNKKLYTFEDLPLLVKVGALRDQLLRTNPFHKNRQKIEKENDKIMKEIGKLLELSPKTPLKSILRKVDIVDSILLFCILHLSLNPTAQEKMADEILAALTPTDPFFSSDLILRSRTLESEKLLKEMMITYCVIPWSPVGKLQKELWVGGYRLPKGSQLLLNYYGSNSDYAPELQPLEKILLPILGSLVAAFKWSTVPGHLDPPTEPQAGQPLAPKPFNVFVRRRI